MSTEALADAVELPPSPIPTRTLTQQAIASLGVTLGPAAAVWTYQGVTGGLGVALVAMETQGWMVPVMAAVAWALNKGYDALAVYRKQQAVIDAQSAKIDSLEHEVADLKDTVAVLVQQVDADKETQLRLRAENNDLTLRLGQYERTPDPDKGISQ